MNIPQEIIDQLQTKKICILGLGREGLSTYLFLRQILPKITLTLADMSALTQLSQQWQTLIQDDKQLSLNLEQTYLDNLDQFNLIFKSPGIPLTTPAVQAAMQAGSHISSNLQLFFEILENFKLKNPPVTVNINKTESQLSQPVIIGVTGTKGKSTTATMIHHVFKANHQPTVLVGNIGQPALNYVDQIESNSKVVIELSSHQLDQLPKSPDIAVIQAVTSEHLDYYQDQTAYLNSKKSITKYQKANQYVIFNQQYPNTVALAQLSSGIKLNFQLEPPANNAKNDILVYIKSHYLTFNDSNYEEQIIATKDVPLLGEHNLLNIAPAIIIGKLFGLKAQQISSSIQTFTSLPHRLEKVATKNGILYVNDSMATMPDAAIAALSCFSSQPIILLAGGHERNQDFKPFAQKIVQTNVKAVALFPANGARLWQEIEQAQLKLKLKKDIKHKIVYSMPEAIAFAQQFAQAGDVILLAPGAASFGVFTDYADRGEQFRANIE